MLQRSALIVRQVGTDVDVCSKEAAGQSKQSGASLASRLLQMHRNPASSYLDLCIGMPNLYSAPFNLSNQQESSHRFAKSTFAHFHPPSESPVTRIRHLGHPHFVGAATPLQKEYSVER